MKANHFVDRRRFIKIFTFVTAYSSLFGKDWTDIWAAELRALAATGVGTLQIKMRQRKEQQTKPFLPRQTTAMRACSSIVLPGQAFMSSRFAPPKFNKH
jgi:hypothetical protein